jgi:2-haloacid dehalogenase
MTSSRSRRSLKTRFAGYGEIITQVWRIKQLEYSWLRSLMRRSRLFVAEAVETV